MSVSIHEFSHFYPPNFLPDPAGGRVSEQLCDMWLMAGVKPGRLSLREQNYSTSFEGLEDNTAF